MLKSWMGQAGRPSWHNRAKLFIDIPFEFWCIPLQYHMLWAVLTMRDFFLTTRYNVTVLGRAWLLPVSYHFGKSTQLNLFYFLSIYFILMALVHWFANVPNLELWILHNICYEFFMFTFYWENKFLIGQARKLCPIKLSFSQF